MVSSRVLDRVGQVLGGRYRLLAPIGTGASASVYLSEDVTLRRHVAVKLLHDALADDEAFLRRFRAEAQAAAALNHPHILSVHDWGEDEGVPYLVTEYLAGGSLRSLLDAGHVLGPAQALLVGLEAARGLEYAHRRGLVHRDVKPANLLFDDEARLRIADFGLARALAEAAWTEPMGAVLGTARYASPEQARGERLDGRSDVYSLAVVLVEAASGVAPFAADTSLGTLMARVDTPLPVPESLGALRPALLAAGTPDPRLRPDAAEFANALLQAASSFDRPPPLPVVGASAEHLLDHDPTETVPIGSPADPGTDAGRRDDRPVVLYDGAHDLDDDDQPDDPGSPGGGRRGAGDDRYEPDVPAWHETGRGGGGTGVDDTAVIDLDGPAPGVAGATASAPTASGMAPARPAGVTAAGRYDGPPDERTLSPGSASRRRRRRWPWVVLAVLLIAGASAAGSWWILEGSIPRSPVPAVVGADAASADARLRAEGWSVVTAEEYADGTVAGTVLGQDPQPGTELKEGEAVSLRVSLGPTLVELPTIAGMPIPEATAALEGLGLTVGEQTSTFDEDVPAGSVLAYPAGVEPVLPKGSAVPVVVSDGPAPRTVPDLAGRAQADAEAALAGLQLTASATTAFSDTVDKGEVIDTEPAAGAQVPRGGSVTLVVSKGPDVVVVPSVAGLSVVEAAAKLEAAGLVVEGTRGSPVLPVVGTTPEQGTTVKRGAAVTIATGVAAARGTG